MQLKNRLLMYEDSKSKMPKLQKNISNNQSQ